MPCGKGFANVNISNVGGVIKKFVDWCDENNTYLAMLKNLVKLDIRW